ncbi:MAG: YaiI/YqxD family protein [Holophaga sp.]|jgi:hypothetical protein
MIEAAHGERPLIQILVDADACPVKDEVFRVARRHGLTVHVVSNKRLNLPRDPLIQPVVVSGRFDAADDWIAGRSTEADVVVTADIPLASRCLKQGARVLDPKGRVFTEDSIGDALAGRELSQFLRDMGEAGGGPKPYTPQDRSRFLGSLENLVQALLKVERSRSAAPEFRP